MLKIQTEPVNEPITLAEAKLHLRIDSSDEDTLINNLISGARRAAERFTRRAFITQTWDLWLNDFPTDMKRSDWWDGVREGPINQVDKFKRELDLRIAPIQSVTHVKFYDEDDTETTFASSKYVLDDISEPGKVVLRRGEVWPGIVLRRAKGINVRFKAGYGDDETDVPDDIRQALLIMIAAWYENRGCETFEIPKPAKAILNSYRLIKI